MTIHDLGRALETLGKQLQEQTTVQGGDPLGYVDPDTYGLGSAARRAVRAGELRASRVGRKLLVEVGEMRRWIELHRVQPPKPMETEGDDVDRVIEMAGRRRRGR